MKVTGAQALMKCLEEQNVDVIFGFPGGAVIDIYDELMKNDKLTHVLVRHEQAAVHDVMARPGAHYVAWHLPNGAKRLRTIFLFTSCSPLTPIV